MKMRRILVGLDGSQREPAVLEVALDLAVRYDARLTLLRAVGLPPEVPSEAWQHPELSLKEFLESNARAALDRAMGTMTDDVRARCDGDVVVGTAWQTLCLTAQAIEADLIVIGSHGYGGLDRVLGTTAARVVNHALCSVFVVRANPLNPASP